MKTKIAVNIAAFLLLGMISVALVTMMTAQRYLVRAEINKGKSVGRVLGDYLRLHPVWDDLMSLSDAKDRLYSLLEDAGATCFFLLTKEQQQIRIGHPQCVNYDEITNLTRKAVASGVEDIYFSGGTLGLFGFQPEYLIVAFPLFTNSESVAGFSLVFPLNAIYRSLKNSQDLVVLFIFLNTGVLAFLGIFRVFKLYLQPLSRLAKRAEEYKEDEPELFTVRKEDNELQRLSSALNRLLRRLSGEKKKLRETVDSLEAANLELKKAQTEIVRAEKLASVGRLSAGIAHEIGNPIGIVTGYLELLKQPGLSEEDRFEYLNRAEKEIERISRIIRQMLEISRPSQGGRQRISVHAVLEEMAQVLAVQPFISRIRFLTTLNASCDEINADPCLLRQVFLNLTLNAADAISACPATSEGHITIATGHPDSKEPHHEPNEEWLLVTFSDNGVGIPAEHLTSVFDPFFTTKEPGKGTGLGLSVSFMIVESFGGRLEVESALGCGTCMKIWLPTVQLANGGLCRSPAKETHYASEAAAREGLVPGLY